MLGRIAELPDRVLCGIVNVMDWIGDLIVAVIRFIGTLIAGVAKMAAWIGAIALGLGVCLLGLAVLFAIARFAYGLFFG